MKLMLRVLMFCFTGLSAVIDSHETIKVEISRDAILPCRLQSRPSDVKRLSVEWKHNGSIVHRYRSLDDDPVQDKNFKNRTSLFKSEMPEGNVSLKLTNVTQRDAGNYTCDVRIKDSVKKCIVTLNVVAKEEVIQEPSPTPKQPENQGLSIEAKITIPVVVIIVLLTIGTAFGVWKKSENTNTQQEPKNNDGRNKRNKRGRKRQKNKKKDNRETVSLQNVGNTSDTSS